ncbi:hypothetical protein GUJ93_ZPchr0014g46562 [Zizania palustris]|uniref:Uncharacterized protein n=1 Tax=Zizania palustris TaxID=103762 RepID=A0A8J5TFY3_ZIZPA|nr:hypothetical protein GUJ93_ZPchr0014g46562 [Zizania palustris]
MQRQKYPYLHCVWHTKAAPARAVHGTDGGGGGAGDGQRWRCGGCGGVAHGLRRQCVGCYREIRGRRAWPARVVALWLRWHDGCGDTGAAVRGYRVSDSAAGVGGCGAGAVVAGGGATRRLSPEKTRAGWGIQKFQVKLGVENGMVEIKAKLR